MIKGKALLRFCK